jgi:hypothetical protein
MAKKIPSTHPVTPGGFWQDAELGRYGRVIQVVDVDDTHATVKFIANGPSTQVALDRYGLDPRRDMRGVVKRIRRDKFRPVRHGWVFIARDAADITPSMRDLAEWLADGSRPHTSRSDGMATRFNRVPAGETFRL